ncbi:holo-ACP synthase [Barrientosiimonas marina]|uniref:Holo-[acyl-carrier-protein] synthase n=1 Tax=Lentibacillus kimchii TaxID=1542911 RepID=A0ABW2UY96_9BACI
MIKGIGIDTIELDRIWYRMKKTGRFADRILTHKEKSFLTALSSERRQAEYLAGRFAAKEAFSKAAGRGIGTLSFQHMDVTTGPSGAPQMSVAGYEKQRIFVSISHSRDHAIAQVVIEETADS